jgi:UPF0755 protein
VNEVSEPRRIVGRPLRFALLAVLSALLVVALWVLHYRSWTLSALPGVADDREVTVAPGGFGETVETLKEAGIIERDLYFRLLARSRGDTTRVRAGTYVISAGMTPGDLLDLLTRGARDEEVALTVPEGYTVFHVADRVEREGLMTRSAFLEAATDRALLDELKIEGESVEGYLFPDTYHLRPNTPPRALIKRMVARHREVWAEIVADLGPAHVKALRDEFGLGDPELLTLASIIEREAVVDGERPIISRVFYNRLEKKMKLQTDPTCIYGPKTYKEQPSPRTCRAAKSRYSTYVIDGLPPGPISNPGRASIRAALDPTTNLKRRDYLYFVARGGASKRHTFSKTYEEHKRAVNR